MRQISMLVLVASIFIGNTIPAGADTVGYGNVYADHNSFNDIREIYSSFNTRPHSAENSGQSDATVLQLYADEFLVNGTVAAVVSMQGRLSLALQPQEGLLIGTLSDMDFASYYQPANNFETRLHSIRYSQIDDKIYSDNADMVLNGGGQGNLQDDKPLPFPDSKRIRTHLDTQMLGSAADPDASFMGTAGNFNNGNSVAIPEPQTVILCTMGLATFMFSRRR
jgi:hypothetical protein